MIEVTGPDKFAMRLFFDEQTHMPLLLSYLVYWVREMPTPSQKIW